MDQNTLTEKELTEQATEAGKEYASKYGQIAGGHVTATCVFADGYIAGYSASHPPSPAKAEQEWPPNWSNKANYSGDSYIGGYHWFHTLMGKVRDIGIYMQQHEVDSILRSFWGQQIRDIYADMSEWFAYIYERESGKQSYREQEGLRWVNLAKTPPCVVEDWEDWHGYHMRYASDRVKLDLHLFELRDGALCKIGGTGRLELSEVEWLDESTPSPVKEAGQPVDDKTFDENLAYEIIARFVANSGKKDSIKKIRKEAFVDGALWAKKYLESRQQPVGESAGVWVPFTKDARLPKNEDFLVKYDTGEIRRYQEEEQPFGIVTHYMILNDDSGASTKEREIAFAFYQWSDRIYWKFEDGWYTAPGEEENVILSDDQVWDLFEQSQNNKP